VTTLVAATKPVSHVVIGRDSMSRGDVVVQSRRDTSWQHERRRRRGPVTL